MARLPVVGGDDGNWGNVLNEFLEQGHREDGSLKGTATVFNVKDFGARGIGEDDTQAIQNTIYALPPEGGVLFFPQGVYGISANLIVEKPLRIAGQGKGSVLQALGTALTALLEIRAGGNGCSVEHITFYGSKFGTGGEIQRGVYINGARRCRVLFCTFSGPRSGTGLNFGVDINGPASNHAQVLYNYFERLVSSSGQGSAILIESSNAHLVFGNIIDGSEFNNANQAPSAAIQLNSSVGQGSSDNVVAYNTIRYHKQAGISVNSTTYFEFPGVLGSCDHNVIEHNEIAFCDSSRGGDASSGISLVGNSHFNKIRLNKIHHNGNASAGGFGIVLSGSRQGEARFGEPRIDEAPSFNEVTENSIYSNLDDGICVKGAVNTIIRGNVCFENGQREPDAFRNIYIASLGGSVTGNASVIRENDCFGTNLKYQIEIRDGVRRTIVMNNNCPPAMRGSIFDQGMETVFGYNVTS